MGVYPVCMSVHYVQAWCPQRQEESIIFPGTVAIDSCDPHARTWVLWKKKLCSSLPSHISSPNNSFLNAGKEISSLPKYEVWNYAYLFFLKKNQRQDCNSFSGYPSMNADTLHSAWHDAIYLYSPSKAFCSFPFVLAKQLLNEDFSKNSMRRDAVGV